MLSRTLIGAMCATSIAAVSAAPIAGAMPAAPIAAASSAPHTRAIRTQLKVLGQAKPDCHGGVCLIHNHGTGTLTGFGRVSFTTSITDDTRTSPCPDGSWVPRLRRVIHTAQGNLVLNEAGLVCVQPKVGPRVDLVWAADGSASTGIFAHVTGTGVDHAYLKPNTAVQTGQITLAG